jgi:hypothetical protein
MHTTDPHGMMSFGFESKPAMKQEELQKQDAPPILSIFKKPEPKAEKPKAMFVGEGAD